MKAKYRHMDTIEQINAILRGREPAVIEEGSSQYRQAAVLVPLFRDKDEYKILFTKRTDRVDEHKGQISFPGGSVDEGDASYKETALREAFEEVGLLREDVRILGRTDDHLTVASNFIIHPFVGFIPYPYPFEINSHEVKRLIEVPFSSFVENPAATRKDVYEFEGVLYEGPVYDYQGDIIWGASARIMENFLEILGEKIGLLASTD
jgi:8-oxo-dGTP pyrophosphatase MutT (NUDIX family)